MDSNYSSALILTSLVDWNEIPKDLLVTIFCFVELQDLLSIRQVNRRWNELSYEKRIFSNRNMGDLIVTGSGDKILKVFQESENDSSLPTSWNEIKTLNGHKDHVIYFSFSYLFKC